MYDDAGNLLHVLSYVWLVRGHLRSTDLWDAPGTPLKIHRKPLVYELRDADHQKYPNTKKLKINKY